MCGGGKEKEGGREERKEEGVLLCVCFLSIFACPLFRLSRMVCLVYLLASLPKTTKREKDQNRREKRFAWALTVASSFPPSLPPCEWRGAGMARVVSQQVEIRKREEEEKRRRRRRRRRREQRERGRKWEGKY